jgi:hypothetical protein
VADYPAGRALVVILEPGLHVSRFNGLFLNIRDLPGVQNVTDLNGITRPTLDALLRLPTPELRQADRLSYNAIRDYHRRKRQPGLL